MSKRKQALATLELDAPSLALVGSRQGRRPGRLSLDRMRPNPDQPRRTLEPGAVLQLAADIQARGLLQPIVVGPPDADGLHMIIAGERRWRACQKADLESAEVVIDYDLTDGDAMFDTALAENIQREDLTRPDLAAAIMRVKTRTGASAEKIAERYSKSESWVRQILAFAELPQPSQHYMDAHRVPTALAKAIRPLADNDQLEVLRALQLDESRDVQMAQVAQVKDLVRGGAPVDEAVAALPPPGVFTPSVPTGVRPTRRVIPAFEWNGDSLRVNFRALAQQRVLPTRDGTYERWVAALVDDVTEVRDLCVDAPAGAAVWGQLRVALDNLLREASAVPL